MGLRKLNTVIIVSWASTSLLLLIHWFTSIEVDFVVRLFSIILTTAISCLGLLMLPPLARRGKRNQSSFLIGSITFCLFLLFLHSTDDDWKTQTILFERSSGRENIEFQMKDIGARGYQRRTVSVTRYLFAFSLIHQVDTDRLDSSWSRINKSVNELGLKGG